MSKDYAAGSIVYFKFPTHTVAPAMTTLAGSPAPAVSVYRDDSTGQSTVGVSLTLDFDGLTGLNHVTIDTSADGTFYAAGHDFFVIITTGTVDGTSVVGMPIGEFSIEKSVARVYAMDDYTINTTTVTDPLDANITSVDTDAISAAGIKADAVTKIQNGLATPTNITGGTIGTVTNLTNLPTMPANWITALGLKSDALAAIAAAWATSDISAAAALHNDTMASLLIDSGRYAQGDPVETALATTARAELAARPAANAPIVDKLTWLVMLLLNKLEQTATTKTLYADNGSTPVATSGATDDGTTFTSGEWT